MIVDGHIHLDLYRNPEKLLKSIEVTNTTAVLVTNLPSHYKQAEPHVQGINRVRLSLGYHPLYVLEHPNQMALFRKYAKRTSFIGEIGLDFSKEGINSKFEQIRLFENILDCIADRTRYVSIHSRNAEEHVFDLLSDRSIKCAVFHWFSGTKKVLSQIIKKGYFFSVNPAMVNSKKGRQIISSLPKERILTETDGPFVKVSGQTVVPKDIMIVLEYLSQIWRVTVEEVENIVTMNFKEIMNAIKVDMVRRNSKS